MRNSTELIELSVCGVAYRSDSPNEKALLLEEKGGDYVVPIPLSKYDDEILFQIEKRGRRISFPAVLDIVRGLLGGFSIHLKVVYILGYKKGSCWAEATFENDDREVKTEMAASIAVAMALQMNSRIFIAPKILNTIGIQAVEDGMGGKMIIQQSDQMKRNLCEQLQEELEDAVKNEEYEKANELKIKINNIKGINN